MLATRSPSHGTESLFGEIPHLFRKGQQGLPADRQGDLAATAIEQGDPELLLQYFDLLRDRRLSQKQLLRGTAEIEMAGHCAKDAYAMIFDHVSRHPDGRHPSPNAATVSCTKFDRSKHHLYAPAELYRK